MMPASDIRSLTSHSNEAREAVTGVFEALEKWRDEISSVNERHATKVFELLASSQRALPWPEHFAKMTKDYLLKASVVQTQMISQVVDAWENQLKSAASPPALPEAFQFQTPTNMGTEPGGSVPDIVRFQEMALVAPFRLWMQAAEMWQRNWAGAMTGSFAPQQERPNRRSAS